MPADPSAAGRESLFSFRLSRRWQWFVLVWTVSFAPPIALAVALFLVSERWWVAYLVLIGNVALHPVSHWLGARSRPDGKGHVIVSMARMGREGAPQ